MSGTGRGRRRPPASEPPLAGAAGLDPEPDAEDVARAILLRLLTGAPRSRSQLAEALAQRDVPEAVAAHLLDRFTDVGLIDDAAYAEMLVRTRHTERGLSKRALAVELRRRGVDEETAAEALERVGHDAEVEAARRLVERKLAATRGLDTVTRRRRTLAALGRRGYEPGLVARLVREALGQEGDPDDAEAGDVGWDDHPEA